MYTSGANCYLSFCRNIGRETFPVVEDTLILFAASLYSSKLVPSTIKTYLAALRYEQISLGLGDPKIAQMVRLEYVIKGIKRHTTPNHRRRLPITPEIHPANDEAVLVSQFTE